MKRKLIAAIACRSSGKRLYGKPLQNLDIKKNLPILEFIISKLKKKKCIKNIVLGIANDAGFDVYKNFAKKKYGRSIIRLGTTEAIRSCLGESGILKRLTATG